MAKKIKTVLITGGAGFLGSHLCTCLIDRGYKVICLDNFITGMRRSIKTLLRSNRFKLITHDISRPIYLKEGIDYILHFASPASPSDYNDYPIQTLKVGALGTHNALGVAKAKKAVFLLASSSEVYGDPLRNPQKEDYWGNVNPVGPRGVYDEAKRFAEAIVMAYNRVHKIDTKIVRIFNTYGPGMRRRDGRAIPNFIDQAIFGKDITVYGNGLQTRSFCYVDDMVEGIYRLLMSGEHYPMNLGNPYEISVLRLAKLVVKLAKSKSRIIHKPLPVDDPKVRRPDITKAKSILKWHPKVDIEAGLSETIAWFKGQRL